MFRERVPRLRAWLYEGIYEGAEQNRHLIAIKNMKQLDGEAFEHDHLYNCLNILDSKAIGLLTYDAIVFAATSLVLSISGRTVSPATVVIVVGLLLSAVASTLCLRVVWVFWTDTRDFEQPQDLFAELLDVRNRRTLCYRWSWILSQASMFLLIVGILLQRVV